MLVPSQYFMNNFELLNQPKESGESFETCMQPVESDYFDCNPSKRELIDESLAFEARQKKKGIETFDANENAQYPIDRTLMKQVQRDAAIKAAEGNQQSVIVDLLEESAYQLVTKNERFIVKFEGNIGDTSAS